MQTTKIEWTDITVSPVTGCNHGCSYCFARRLAHRFASVKGTVYHRLAQSGFDPFVPAFHADVYERALARLTRMRTAKRVMISSMGDIGVAGDICYTEQRAGRTSVFRYGSDSQRVQELIVELAHRASQHTYQVLTKRPQALWGTVWPDNVHVGTSIESTKNRSCINRIATLMRVDARTRWISIEPLLDAQFDTSFLNPGLSDERAPSAAWIVVGGLSRQRIPHGCVGAAQRIVAWAHEHRVPCFVKNNMRKYDQAFPWPRDFPRSNEGGKLWKC